jgi:hypothetical protein
MGVIGFYNHIINIGIDKVILYLVLEIVLDGALVCSPCVLEPERHCHVAVGTERRDESRLDLVVLVESDLVITRVTIQKDSSSQPAVESTTSSIRGKPKGSLG